MRVRQVVAVTLLLGAGVVFLVTPTFGLGVTLDLGDEAADAGAAGFEGVDIEGADSDAPEAGIVATETNQTGESDSAGESGLGTQVSSFAQSSAADVNTTMEMGLWEVSLTGSADPGENVTARTEALFDRLTKLEAQVERLELLRQNGSISEEAYNARASALQARLTNSEATINHIEQTAQRVGAEVDRERVDSLRNEAGNVAGPEVAEAARAITDAPRGPPDHAGPGNESEAGPPDHAGPGNGSEVGPPGNSGNDSDVGPPGNPGNDSDAGPPENPGNDSEVGPPENPGNDSEVGPPDHAGPGNDSDAGPPENPGNDSDAGPPDHAGPGNDSDVGPPEWPGNESHICPPGWSGNETDVCLPGNETGVCYHGNESDAGPPGWSDNESGAGPPGWSGNESDVGPPGWSGNETGICYPGNESDAGPPGQGNVSNGGPTEDDAGPLNESANRSLAGAGLGDWMGRSSTGQ